MSMRRAIFGRERSRTAKGEEGSSLVETALVLPTFFLFIIGIIEFSMIVFAYHSVTEMARDAARWAVVRGSQCYSNLGNATYCGSQTGSVGTDIQTYVQGLGYPGLVSSNITVATSYYSPSAAKPPVWTACTSGTCNKPQYRVDVQVSYTYPIFVPFWQSASIPLSSTASMVIAQ